jgi:phage baseplate assembly protein gpV
LGGCVVDDGWATSAAVDGRAERSISTTEPAPKAIEIDTRFVDVTLVVGTAETVSIEGNVVLETSGGDATAEREIERVALKVVREGDRLIVRQGEKDARPTSGIARRGSGTLRIALPAGIPFEIDSASGDVTLEGDFGAVEGDIDIASGAIGGRFACKELDVDAASGQTAITLLRPLEKLEWDGASGGLTVVGPVVSAIIDSASGSIDLADVTTSCEVDVASGSVKVRFSSFGPEARFTADSASGSVVVHLPANASPSGTISTASGSIESDFPSSSDRRTKTLTGTGGRVSIDTASGSVRIRRAAE